MAKKTKTTMSILYMLAKAYLGAIAITLLFLSTGLALFPEEPGDVAIGVTFILVAIGFTLTLIAWIKEVSEA